MQKADADDAGWIEVISRSDRRRNSGDDLSQRRLLDSRHLSKFRSRPTRHFWTGFDESGAEKWFLELENGNILASSDTSYSFLVKKFFPNDACHA